MQNLLTHASISDLSVNTPPTPVMELYCSAVTIIVGTIFIAIFQNYRIVFLSRYFLCVRNDIFARYLRYASTIKFTASLLNF